MDIPSPENKDWTWVVSRRCPECGFDASKMQLDKASEILNGAVVELRQALSHSSAQMRPKPTTWSPVEYACHVRDTCDVFRDRIALVLAKDDPTFANWDQDATAIEKRYDRQDARVVAVELQQSLDGLIHTLDTIPADAWDRPALRSNGSRFTLASLVRYLVHDPVHHVYDVTRSAGLLSRAPHGHGLTVLFQTPPDIAESSTVSFWEALKEWCLALRKLSF